MKEQSTHIIYIQAAKQTWRRRLVRRCVLWWLLLVPMAAQSQQSERSPLEGVPSELFLNRLDTLSLGERFSFRANMVDWALLVPNVSVEFDLGSRNWSKWTLGIGGRYNGNARNTFSPYYVYNIREFRGEIRRYWHTTYRGDRVRKPYNAPKRWNPIRRALSRQRANPREHRAYYLGAFVAQSSFSFKLGAEGKQGTATSGGLTVGVQTPLYGYRGGGSLDFECGLSAGVAAVEYDTYRYDRDGDCYPLTGHVNQKIQPVLSELRLALVYRFGRSSVERYKDRYRVDYGDSLSYQERYDARQTLRESARINKQTEKKQKQEDKVRHQAEKKKLHEAKQQQKAEERQQRKEEKNAKKEDEKKEDGKGGEEE